MIGERLLFCCVERGRVALGVELVRDEAVRPLAATPARRRARRAARGRRAPAGSRAPPSRRCPASSGSTTPFWIRRAPRDAAICLEPGDELRAEATTSLVGMHEPVDPPQLAAVVERPEGDHSLAVEEDERVAREVERLPFRLEVVERVLGRRRRATARTRSRARRRRARRRRPAASARKGLVCAIEVDHLGSPRAPLPLRALRRLHRPRACREPAGRLHRRARPDERGDAGARAGDESERDRLLPAA